MEGQRDPEMNLQELQHLMARCYWLNCPPKFVFEALVPQIVTVFADSAFKEAIKLKQELQSGA